MVVHCAIVQLAVLPDLEPKLAYAARLVGPY